MKTWGAVELGGTKALVGAGTSWDDFDDHVRIATTTPEQTISQIVDVLSTRSVAAVGVASFGPLDLNQSSATYGHITATPKPHWSWFDLVGALVDELNCRVVIDTDVNAAAIGEATLGSPPIRSVLSYVTIGTGVGGGTVLDGTTLQGAPHPEFGHVVVRRHNEDSFPGVCPFHGDCLEGMICGPAIEARFESEASLLGDSDASAATDLIAFYLAQGLRSLAYVAAPERIVVGGGLSYLPGFHDAVREALVVELAGYPEVPLKEMSTFVTRPDLGELSGLAGAWLLAQKPGM